MRVLGPLPLIEMAGATLIPVLPGELEHASDRRGRVRRDRLGLLIEMRGVALRLDLRTERALRSASRILLVEADQAGARGLGPLTLTWDL